MKYNVFHRTWWKINPEWFDGKEPCAGRKHYIAKGVGTMELAREIAQDWNGTHEQGILSDKAEFEWA